MPCGLFLLSLYPLLRPLGEARGYFPHQRKHIVWTFQARSTLWGRKPKWKMWRRCPCFVLFIGKMSPQLASFEIKNKALCSPDRGFSGKTYKKEFVPTNTLRPKSKNANLGPGRPLIAAGNLFVMQNDDALAFVKSNCTF